MSGAYIRTRIVDISFAIYAPSWLVSIRLGRVYLVYNGLNGVRPAEPPYLRPARSVRPGVCTYGRPGLARPSLTMPAYRDPGLPPPYSHSMAELAHPLFFSFRHLWSDSMPHAPDTMLCTNANGNVQSHLVTFILLLYG